MRLLYAGANAFSSCERNKVAISYVSPFLCWCIETQYVNAIVYVKVACVKFDYLLASNPGSIKIKSRLQNVLSLLATLLSL